MVDVRFELTTSGSSRFDDPIYYGLLVVCWATVISSTTGRRLTDGLLTPIQSLIKLPFSRNSYPGSHGRLFSALPPTAVRALHFYREKDSALYSLVDSSRRIVPTHAMKVHRRSRQVGVI